MRDYTDGWHAEASLAAYFDLYDEERIRQALGYRTPAEIYRDGSRRAGCRLDGIDRYDTAVAMTEKSRIKLVHA